MKFSNHPSVIKINQSVGNLNFSFVQVHLRNIKEEIMALDSTKASYGIPTKFRKKTCSVCSNPLLHIIHDGISNSSFDDGLKCANITPVHKKGETTDKTNYRPVSILPVVSKIFERVMHKQIGVFMEDYLSPFLCGYRKAFNAQHALISLLEKWHISLDNKGANGPI